VKRITNESASAANRIDVPNQSPERGKRLWKKINTAKSTNGTSQTINARVSKVSCDIF
jgi:hypothetical protein